MRGGRILSGVLAASAVLPPAHAGDAALQPRTRFEIAFDAALDTRYDDNIIQLSPQDIARLERTPDSSRFRITTPDDWVLVGRFQGRYERQVLPRRDTRVLAGADLFRYQTNEIKNWEEYHLVLDQELSASRKHLSTLRVAAEWQNGFYLRELTDDDASFEAQQRVRRSAFFDETSVGVTFGQEIVEHRLTGSIGWLHSDRDYVEYFDERDGVRTAWSAEIRARLLEARGLQLTLRGSTGNYDARGDLPSTPIPDDDISYDFSAAEAGASLAWGEKYRTRVEAGFGREGRNFTTNNVFDTFRYGRHDRRDEYGLRVTQKLGRDLDLALWWSRQTNEATAAPGILLRDDVTNYQENRFGVTLHVRLATSSSATAVLVPPRSSGKKEPEFTFGAGEAPRERARSSEGAMP